MALPHDSLFKQTFSNVKHAAVELRVMLPPALLHKLDLSTLQVRPGSFVDRSLRQVHSDLLYSVQLGSQQAYIYVLSRAPDSSRWTRSYSSCPAALVPSFRFLLDDLNQVSDAALRARAHRDAELIVPLVLWAFRDGRNKERLLSSVVE